MVSFINLDANQQLNITYKINCAQSKYDSLKESWGANYQDATTPNSSFLYVSDSPNDKLVLSNFASFNVEFRILK